MYWTYGVVWVGYVLLWVGGQNTIGGGGGGGGGGVTI